MTLEPTDVTDFGDPADRLVPIRMVAARNGMTSGQVIVSSDEPISDLSVRVGPLHHGGDGAQRHPFEATGARQTG